MLKNYDDLSPVAIDCLREIGNIGSGSAASSLSEMLGKTIEMKVPNVCVLEYQQIIDAMGGPEKVITGILVRLEGDIKGMMMFLLEDSFAQVVLSTFMNAETSRSQSSAIWSFQLSPRWATSWRAATSARSVR